MLSTMESEVMTIQQSEFILIFMLFSTLLYICKPFLFRYIIPVSLEGLVEDLNPAWNDETSSSDDSFTKAMEVVGNIFRERVLYIHKHWMPARKIVEDAVNNRLEVRQF